MHVARQPVQLGNQDSALLLSRSRQGSCNWYAVIDTRDPSTGKRKRKWQRLEGEITGIKQARIACADLLASRRNGTYQEPNKTTLAEFLERWLENVKPNVSPRTHERYGEIVRTNVVPLLGAVLVSKLTPAQISAAYSRALSEGRRDGKGGLSPQSVQHIHCVLKQALGPVRWERIHRNSEDHIVRPPKVEKREMKVYDVPQTVNLIDVVRGKRVFIPVVLAAMCGLRRGEVAGLRWGDVDLDKGTLTVIQSAEQTRAGIRYKEPKRGKRSNVSLSASVVQELRTWRVQQAQELLRLGIRRLARRSAPLP